MEVEREARRRIDSSGPRSKEEAKHLHSILVIRRNEKIRVKKGGAIVPRTPGATREQAHNVSSPHPHVSIFNRA